MQNVPNSESLGRGQIVGIVVHEGVDRSPLPQRLALRAVVDGRRFPLARRGNEVERTDPEAEMPNDPRRRQVGRRQRRGGDGHVPHPRAVFDEPLQHLRDRLHPPSGLRLPKRIERPQILRLRTRQDFARRVLGELFVTDRTAGVSGQPRPLEPRPRQVVQHVVHVPSDRLHGTPHGVDFSPASTSTDSCDVRSR